MTSHSHRRSTRAPKRLQLTFSEGGFDILVAYRARLSKERGRMVPLAEALDELLKTHSLRLRGE